MKKWIAILWFAFMLAVGGAAAFYLFAPGAVPVGQTAMGKFQLDDWRAAFSQQVSKPRLVAQFTCSRSADLQSASALQTVLSEYEGAPLAVHVIWQPQSPSDWFPVPSDALARIWDPRVRQYWDKAMAAAPVLGQAQLLLYSRGAGPETPAIRIHDIGAEQAKIREFLGAPPPPQVTPGSMTSLPPGIRR